MIRTKTILLISMVIFMLIVMIILMIISMVTTPVLGGTVAHGKHLLYTLLVRHHVCMQKHRLAGLVVKASASRAEDPGFESRW